MSQNSIQGVFLDAATLGSDIDLSVLGSMSCHCWDTSSPEQVIARAKDADYIVTNKVIINKNVMSQLPKLKLICVAATGVNNIDIPAAKELGITVKNVTNYAGSSIAQLVFSLLSELLLHTNHYSQLVRAGKWSDSPHFCLFDKPIIELTGKTIGLIGYGALAKSVEKVALAYDMKVLIAGRKGQSKLDSNRLPFEQVLRQADIVSIHCPLTADTTDLIAAEEFAIMKPSAVLINTARGGIVNEVALLQALASKQIAAAATDVLTVEPPTKDHPLLLNQPDNLIITPHIAWATREARSRVLEKVVNNIKEFFE